jgi:endonuclease/exonuclease/phosphatase family metal-dependent hydrolase
MKLVTWNTQWCCGLDGVVSVRRIVEGARAMADFDVLCLQEIACGFDDMPGRPGDQPAELRALLPGFHLFFGAAVDEFDAQGRRQRFGNVIATRLPVSRVQQQALPWPADPGAMSMPRLCSTVTVTAPGLGLLRVMTTHLEYYSASQRLAQARALRELHGQACAQAARPPRAPAAGAPATPFQPKAHTAHALLCGDFNMAATDPAYAEILQPCATHTGPDDHGREKREKREGPDDRLRDAWPLVHPGRAHDPTFRLFDRRYGPDPMACDFVFVSAGLAPNVRRVEVDLQTRASDHQPVVVELGAA